MRKALYSKMPLSLKQQKLVALHVDGFSNVDAAKELNISRPTVISWLKRPEIQEAIASAKQSQSKILNLISDEDFKQKILTLSTIENGVLEAYDLLLEIMRNPEERVSNKLKCIEILFSLPGRIYNLDKSISTVRYFGFQVIDESKNNVK